MLRQGTVAWLWNGFPSHGSSGAAVAETTVGRKGDTAVVSLVQLWKAGQWLLLLNPGNGDFFDSESLDDKGGSQKEAGSPWGKGGEFLWLELQAGMIQEAPPHCGTSLSKGRAGGLGNKAAKHVSQRSGCFSATSEQVGSTYGWVVTAKQGQGVLREREQKTINMSRWEKSLWEQKFDKKKSADRVPGAPPALTVPARPQRCPTAQHPMSAPRAVRPLAQPSCSRASLQLPKALLSHRLYQTRPFVHPLGDAQGWSCSWLRVGWNPVESSWPDICWSRIHFWSSSSLSTLQAGLGEQFCSTWALWPWQGRFIACITFLKQKTNEGLCQAKKHEVDSCEH